MNEEITLRLETFNDKEYILADECIKAIGIHRKTNTKLHKEIKRLKEEYMILQNASDEVEEELQQRIDKALSYLRDIGNWLRDDSSYRAKLIDILQGSDKE